MRVEQGKCHTNVNTPGTWITWVLSAKTDHEKTVLERQIAATDGQIDELVYELCGLTDEETGVGGREKVVN